MIQKQKEDESRGGEKDSVAVNEEINHAAEDIAVQSDRVEDPVNKDRDGDIEGTSKVTKGKNKNLVEGLERKKR